MRAGRLRDIIHFGIMVKTSDGMGGVTQEFREVASVYGRVIPSASETSLNGDTRNIYNYTFECRYVDGIKPNMVIRMNNETTVWNISNVIDPSGKRERLEFSATREVENAVYVPQESESDNE